MHINVNTGIIEPEFDMRDLEQFFKGLADQTRLRIINLLIHGELCVCDIQYVLESSQSNVSRHLTYLRNSGLVLDRREGTRMYYRLAEPSERVRKLLFTFLRDAFQSSEALEEDSRKLKKAIETGSCIVSEWKPSSALGRSRGADTKRA
jgi:ArsR family transcriptional regulator